MIRMAFSKDECIDALNRLDGEVEESITSPQYKRLSKDEEPSVTTLKRKFGSWNKAKEKALLDLNPRGGRSKDVNAGYFDVLDHESAYWIGFLLGDASVNQIEGRQRRLTIQLHENDRIHLELFRDSIESGHDVYSIESRPHVGLQITSDSLVECLAQHGMDEKKLNSGSMPDVERGLEQDVVRGLFDADGSIGKRTWLLYGREARLDKVAEMIPVGSSMHEREWEQYESVWQLVVGGQQKMQTLYDWLYTSGPCLARKKEKFKRIVR